MFLKFWQNASKHIFHFCICSKKVLTTWNPLKLLGTLTKTQFYKLSWVIQRFSQNDESSVLPLTWMKKMGFTSIFHILQHNSDGLDIFSQSKSRRTQSHHLLNVYVRLQSDRHFFNKIDSVCFGHINRGKNVVFGQTCIFLLSHTHTNTRFDLSR